MPPVYVANGASEFIAAANATTYTQMCQRAGLTVWLRIPATSQHATGHARYTFTGSEQSQPQVGGGTTVLQDSISFADRYVHVAA